MEGTSKALSTLRGLMVHILYWAVVGYGSYSKPAGQPAALAAGFYLADF